MHECIDCGDALVTGFEIASGRCESCYAALVIPDYDEDDEADMVLGQERDEVGRE